MKVYIDRHVYHPTHGPHVFPWWRLVTVHVVRASHDPQSTRKSWNIWAYTRWGALCGSVSVRK